MDPLELDAELFNEGKNQLRSHLIENCGPSLRQGFLQNLVK